MTRNAPYRDLDVVLDSPLWPLAGFGPADPEADRRHMALANVLLRIPNSGYKKLNALANRFSWFIPVCGVGAMVQPFPVTDKTPAGRSQAIILYLCPSLEVRGFDVIVATVAHEFAHLVLGHELSTQPDQYDAQEKEAWALIRKWGFEAEERKHVRFHQRRAQRERAPLERFWSQIRAGR